jgi:hypothetical protein
MPDFKKWGVRSATASLILFLLWKIGKDHEERDQLKAEAEAFAHGKWEDLANILKEGR